MWDWLVNMDPCNGLLWSLLYLGNIIPLFYPTNQGFFVRGSCSQKDSRTHCWSVGTPWVSCPGPSTPSTPSPQQYAIFGITLDLQCQQKVVKLPNLSEQRTNQKPLSDPITSQAMKNLHVTCATCCSRRLNTSRHSVPSSDNSESGSNLLDGTYQSASTYTCFGSGFHSNNPLALGHC